MICRSGWSKQGGFELFLEDGSKGDQLWDLVWEAGQAYDIRVGAPNYAERIENFLLSWGSDTDPDSDPFEAAIGKYVDLGSDHEFVGKRALLAKRDQGPTRELKGLLIDGEPLDPNPEPVGLQTPNGSYAGQARVVAYSPRYERNLGLAIVEVPQNLPGTKLQVHTPTGWRTAIVSDLPFDL